MVQHEQTIHLSSSMPSRLGFHTYCAAQRQQLIMCRLEPIMTDRHRLCLDYSVAKGGHLAAYQWDGEDELDPSKLVYIS